MRLWKSDSQYLRVINVKSAESVAENLDYKHTPVPLALMKDSFNNTAVSY